MSKRILYLEDLYQFYAKSNNSVHFSTEDTDGAPLVVQTIGKVMFDKDDEPEKLTKLKIRAAHTDINRNGSQINIDVMTNALPSLKNRPILGYIHEVNGVPQFKGHEMHEDANGDIVYDERPIGIIPETNNAKIVYDDIAKKSYVECDGYIFDDYSKAKEIFEREGECACSVELSIKDLSYNAKDQILVINDFIFSGITVLGVFENGLPVLPGMEGANMKLADFTLDTKADFSNQVIEMQGKLDAILSHFDIEQNSAQLSCEEGGNEMSNENINNIVENAEEPIVTESQIEEPIVEDVAVENEGEPVVVEPTSDEQGASSDEGVAVQESTENESETEPEVAENYTRTFELSHDDIRCGLYKLLDAQYGEDAMWIWISQVYDDRFIYEYGHEYFGQKYTKDGDEVAFDGDPYTVHAEFVTDSELDVLNTMRSNYQSLVDFKNQTEQNQLHAEREAVLCNEKYSVISETEAYKALYAEMDKYSCDELNERLMAIVGDFALSSGKFEQNEKETKSHTTMFFRDVNSEKKTKNKYGTLKFNK